jgi:hypothetical protein
VCVCVCVCSLDDCVAESIVLENVCVCVCVILYLCGFVFKVCMSLSV